MKQPRSDMKQPRSDMKGGTIVVKLCILLLTFLIGVGALEVAARMILDEDGMNYGVEMWKYAKYLKQESSVLGHEHRPGGAARLMGVDVRISSQGLRDREFSPEKPANTYRILVLGDSMTFGWGAALEDTYAKVLEARLNEEQGQEDGRRFEVINAGVGNYNAYQEVAYFKTEGIELDPDMVIIGLYINDAEETPRASDNILARHSYLYVFVSHTIDALMRKMGWKAGFREYYSSLYRDDAPGWRTFREALGELADLCREREVELLAVQIPELHNPGPGYPFREIHHKVGRVLVERGVRVIDLSNAFDDIDPESLWVSPGDAHPNAKAHRVIADRIYDQIAGGAAIADVRDAP